MSKQKIISKTDQANFLAFSANNIIYEQADLSLQTVCKGYQQTTKVLELSMVRLIWLYMVQ